MNLQKGTFKNFHKASVPAVFGSTSYPTTTTTTFCPFVFLFKTHAETSAPGRAVGKSGQAAAWTCPLSSSAA